MNKIIDLDELYKVRGDLSNYKFDGFSITIDDFYENAEDLYEHITSVCKKSYLDKEVRLTFVDILACCMLHVSIFDKI